MDGYSFEDEEWERHIKKELAAKKKESLPSSSDPEQKAQIEEQDACRKRVKAIIDFEYKRVAESIMALSLPDIEIGNTCLPILGQTVIRAAISNCVASQRLGAFETFGSGAADHLGSLCL
jgi:hypothetical protein